MQEQSFQAKLVKECIRLAAGNRLIERTEDQDGRVAAASG